MRGRRLARSGTPRPRLLSGGACGRSRAAAASTEASVVHGGGRSSTGVWVRIGNRSVHHEGRAFRIGDKRRAAGGAVDEVGDAGDMHDPQAVGAADGAWLAVDEILRETHSWRW